MRRLLFSLIVLWLLATAAVGVLAEPPEAAEATEDGALEHWFLLTADGTPAGWMLDRQIHRDGRRTTVSVLHLRFRRGSSENTLELESRFVETEDGRPISAWSRQNLGARPAETTWEFQSGGVVVETSRGGEAVRKQMPLPAGEWLTPGQIQPYLRQQAAEGTESFTIRTLDPQLGLELVETEWLLDARDEQLEVEGRPMRARRYRQRQSFSPHVEAVVHMNDDGLVVRSVTPMLGLEMVTVLSRRETVLAASGAPELLARSFVYPDRPIVAPRRTRRALYEVYVEEGVLEDLPSVGAQRVVGSHDGSRVRVEVDLASRPDDDTRGAKTRGAAEEYLRASTYLDHDQPGVHRLLTDAGVPADAGTDPRTVGARAEALRAFVAGYLNDKNLDSVLATASEVAESRSGDCTEHSVLLTALLRAAGIPARVVTGLVYVERLAGERDLFGYHMWSQALIDERWVDLDATLESSFDAAHVAFGTSALNDDASTLAELAKLATFIGRAGIRVIEVEHSEATAEESTVD